jgi:hypothetical protein
MTQTVDIGKMIQDVPTTNAAKRRWRIGRLMDILIISYKIKSHRKEKNFSCGGIVIEVWK